MFDIEQDVVRVGIAAATNRAQQMDTFIPLESLSTSMSCGIISDRRLDLLLVSGATPQQVELITSACDAIGCVVAFVGHPSNDETVIWNVIENVKGKLDAHEMPNNIDIADIRSLAEEADYLLAFDDEASLFQFLQTTPAERHLGGIYLASGRVTLNVFAEMNERIEALISPYAYFVSSFYSASTSECSALIGVRASA